MSVIPLQAFQDNYIWTIVNEKEHTITCVDPGEASPVIAYAQKNSLKLTHILLTHHHHDHIGGVEELLTHSPTALVYGPDDARIPMIHIAALNEDIIQIDHLSLRVIDIPGHTSTHICYHERTNGWLFCGDTLFSAGCGRVFDGTIEDLYHSIERLKQLPDDTKLFCGHEYTLQNLRFASLVDPNNSAIQGYIKHLTQQTNSCSLPSTIAHEKKINPFFRTDLPEIQAYGKANGVFDRNQLTLFKLLREKKDLF
jgi:hydroxyacylglutathione hydrolase